MLAGIGRVKGGGEGLEKEGKKKRRDGRNKQDKINWKKRKKSLWKIPIHNLKPRTQHWKATGE